jgi:hypothetical protein
MNLASPAADLPPAPQVPPASQGAARHVIFLHIPKTAGMSMHGLFVRNYRGQRIHNMEVKDITAEQWTAGLDRIRHLPRGDLARTKVFKGHMIFGLHELLPGASEYITFLRDPVRRIVSHYKMVHGLGAFPPGHTLDPRAELWGLQSYPAFHRSLDNYQVRAISGLDFDVPFGGIGEEHLARAKENLDRHFAFVGLTEKFDLSLMLMRHVCGWGWRHYIADNVAAKDNVMISSYALGELQRLNRFDFELYRYAEERFDRLLHRYGWPLRAQHQLFRVGNDLHRRLHFARHEARRLSGVKVGRGIGAK